MSATSSTLSPLAAEFTPAAVRAPKPAKIKIRYEIRDAPGKGLGMFATHPIKRGSLILAEAALISIPDNELPRAWSAYCNLSAGDKAKFDSLHYFIRPEYEQASRLYLVDTEQTEEMIDAQVAEHIRVMSTFGCNDFSISASGQGVFFIASRMNHSCVPNVHHSYNPTLEQELVYAIRDIYQGEEILTTYIGGSGSYQQRELRQQRLLSTYGFVCDCKACTSPVSDARRHELANLILGLQQYMHGLPPTSPLTPRPMGGLAALSQCEQVITLFIEEGLVHMELAKAYRSASIEAANLDYSTKAFEYAYNEAEVERNCLGTMLQDLIDAGCGAQVWIDELRRRFSNTALANHGRSYVQKKAKQAKRKAQRARDRAEQMREQSGKLEAERGAESAVASRSEVVAQVKDENETGSSGIGTMKL